MNLRPANAESRGEMVARDRERSALAAFRREASEGHGRIVLLGGEPGIGKSRLLRQFAANLRTARTISAFARCVEFVQTPLGPLRELLAQLERNTSIPRDPRTQALLERARFEQDGAGLDTWPGALFEAMDAAFARYAASGTLILLIDDLQWADRSTLGFLTFAAERIGRRRMLIVATYRPDDLDVDPPRMGTFAAILSKPNVTNLAIGALEERAIRTIVELRLPHPKALVKTTVADIVRRSHGNPFFAEELTKHALDRQAGSESGTLPLSIRGAVLARASSLSDEERKILSVAAVLGEHFSFDRLVALCKENREEILSALEHARSLHLLQERQNGGELSFRHALTQEVLYSEMLAERVRPLHEAIALELEREPETVTACVELAHHWWRAGDRTRAAAYAERAGDRALAMGAAADSLLYYERALGGGDANRAPHLEHKIGIAFGALGDLPAGILRLRNAGDLFWKRGEFDDFAKNASALGAQMYNSGQATAAIDLYRETIEMLGPKLPAQTVDLLRARIAFNSIAALDIETAVEFTHGLREPIDDPATASFVYQARFKIAAIRGDVDNWRADAQRAVESARLANDDGYRLRNAHVQVGLDAIGLGALEEARNHFSASISQAGDREVPGRTLAEAASALEHVLRGDFAGAAQLLEPHGSALGENYAVRAHVRTANLVLGICAGDDLRLRPDDTESFLLFGIEHGMKLPIGILGGPHAWALALRGDQEKAAIWVARMAQLLPGPHRFPFAYLAAARYGAESDVSGMRTSLAAAAERPQDRVNRAVLALFDAFAAQRGVVKADARARGREAAAAFQAIGWPWFAACGFELAGETARALDIYRTLRSLRDVRRLEASAAESASDAVLSPRELQVAALVAEGNSNEEVARTLHISLKTVEKHVSSALRKLNLRSRVQLGRYFIK